MSTDHCFTTMYIAVGLYSFFSLLVNNLVLIHLDQHAHNVYGGNIFIKEYEEANCCSIQFNYLSCSRAVN
jgi:hypothetical protein